MEFNLKRSLRRQNSKKKVKHEIFVVYKSKKSQNIIKQHTQSKTWI